MDLKELTRHPLFLLVAAAVIAIVFYYIASPYQNCARGFETNSQIRYYCQQLSW